MSIYEITFENEEGKRKTFKIKSPGMIPAIKAAINKIFSGADYWEVVKAERIGDSKGETICHE